MKHVRRAARSILVAMGLVAGCPHAAERPAAPQAVGFVAKPDSTVPFESRCVDAGGLRLHYLDSGGEGLPLVLLHSEAWDAWTYQHFGPRFSDRTRVLAVTTPGYGQSEGGGYDVPSQAESLIGFLDALTIDRAVFAGNASATAELTYLAEHHPARVAGVIYFTGLALPRLEEHASDPTRARSEAMGTEAGIGALALVGSPLMSGVRSERPPSPVRDHLDRLATEAFRAAQIDQIRDPEARAYFSRLETDHALQVEIHRHHEQVVLPAMLAVQDRFHRAFGDRLHMVPVARQAIGYGYRDAPEAIAPHIRRFLEDVRPSTGAADTAHVAPPTGEKATDRASILAALEQVEPGGTVQFAAGTYLVGEIVRVSTPGITLLGHPDGTILRGCNPEDFVDPDDFFSCNGLELAGARQTIRGFTFENTFWGIHLGCCFGERATLTLPDGTSQVVPALYRTEGGHRVEGNTFRSAASGVRVNGDWTEPAIIRNNHFVNNWHAVSINGHTVHLLDNHISVPEPHLTPFFGFPWDGIKISPTLPLQELDEPQTSACTGNLVEGNHVEGHIDGIRIELYFPGTTCRGNVVRNNTIVVQRMRILRPEGFTLIDTSDSTFVGVPISLVNEPVALERAEPGAGTAIEDNVIEGNRIVGAEGIAIEVLHASRNRIANNTISDVVVRDPFPGNTMGPRGAQGLDLEWRDANGSGIWVSPGSDENEISGNTFTDLAFHAIVLEGDRNRVELRSASDAIHDLGSGNVVVSSPAPSAAHEAVEALTARFVRALNDESWRFLAPFYAPDAVLALPGGAVLQGREAILDYFRPVVARIRAVDATSSRTEEDDRGVTVTTTYTARFAPVPDPVPATFSNTWARQPDGSWLIVAGTFDPPGDPDVESHGTIRGGYFHSEGVRLHYLDFGGEGVPVLFISSGDRTAYAFMEFAPRFTDRNRVLALSQRGAGPSGGQPAPVVDPVVLGRDIVTLLDSLGIERAVVAHMWQEVLVYLAEEHPERLAGLVFLGGGVPEAGWRGEDPFGLFRMLERSRAAIWGADRDASHTWGYVPLYLETGASVGVPSLLFVDEARTTEDEWEEIMDYARLAGQSEARALFPDSLAREFFEHLATDVERQERGRLFWRDTVEPVQRAAEEAFHRAFDGVLRTVPVEGRAIGYGYRDAPDLIEPHIRRFLDELRTSERR